MEFPHSFYEDEIRCNFLVPSMVKRTWAAEIEILSDLDEAFLQNGLSWFADWGTLLGAVRHSGFIPWDDDVDICMKRADYDRLMNDPGSILPEGYSVVSYRSSRSFNQMICRIVSSDHYRFDSEYMHKYSGLPFALGVDVFPLDYLTDDKEYEKEREDRINLVFEAVNEMAVYGTAAESIREHLRKIEKACNVRIDMKSDVLTFLRRLLEKLFAEVEEKDAKYVTVYPLWINRHIYRMPVEYYSTVVRIPFENSTVCVPAYYDAALKMKYGSSYMRCIRGRGAHDYPCFIEHVNVLKEHFNYEWPAYKFSASDFVKPSAPAEIPKTCLFITYCPKAYENMRSLVSYYAEKGCDVTVYTAPHYDIAPDMTGICLSADTAPDEYYTGGSGKIKVAHDAAVLDSRPDIIFSNYPYDEYNLITAVDKELYSKSLRSRTDRLVYVPPFEAGPPADDEQSAKLMPQYVCTPMAAVCDEIVLHSPEMAERYIACLTDFSGKEYEEVWKDKISVFSDERAETESGRSRENPDERRKVLFYVGIGFFAQSQEMATEKIRKAFEVFDKNAGRIELVFRMQEGLLDNLKEQFPRLYELFNAVDFPFETEEIRIEDIDAYYGEASVYMTECVNAGKPVMLIS